MNRSTILALAGVYTLLVSVMISIADVSGAVVVAVAWAWFSIGRAWDRLPTLPEKPSRPVKWGRQ